MSEKRLQKITTYGKTHEQHVAIAKALDEGETIYKAMKDNGYTDAQARKGRKALPRGVMDELKKRGKTLVQLGKSMSNQDKKHLIEGRLMANIMDGDDGGSTSAKILGSSKDLNLWQAENQTGMIVISSINGAEADVSRLSEPD